MMIEPVKKGSKNLIIKRASSNYKCDVCGRIFSGDNSQAEYLEHREECKDDGFNIEHIKNPNVIDVIVDCNDKSSSVVNNGSDGINKLLREMEECSDNVVTWGKRYCCNVCRLQSAASVDVDNASEDNPATAYEWAFETLEQYDQHLWDKHDLVVVRRDNFSVVNRVTGDKLT